MSESTKKQRTVRLPNFVEALLPIVVMMALMLYGLHGDYYVDAHMPLVVSIVVACAVGCACGHSFSDMLAGMLDRLNATMEAILILMTVGLLVASFIMSGKSILSCSTFLPFSSSFIFSCIAIIWSASSVCCRSL